MKLTIVAHPQHLTTADLHCISLNLPIVEISQKCNYTICNFLAWPHSLNIFSRFSHIAACSLYFYFFSWLNDIPLHVYSIFIHLYIYMLWTFGLFPLFGCYEKCCYEHMCMCICLNTCFQSFFLGMKLVGHMEILCLTFRGTAKWFSLAAESFYIPTSNAQSSNFSRF